MMMPQTEAMQGGQRTSGFEINLLIFNHAKVISFIAKISGKKYFANDLSYSPFLYSILSSIPSNGFLRK